MAKQIINVGQTANDKKGDSLRAAFTKVNANFTDLYSLGFKGWVFKTSDYTASPGDRIIANTSTGPFNITLPSNPIQGTFVEIADGFNFAINNLILISQRPVEGFDEDIVINIQGLSLEFVYVDASWQILTTLGVKGDKGDPGEGIVAGSNYNINIVADDSTVLINGSNGGAVNLDGTVRGDIVPDQDSTYDLGSPTKQWRSLYVSTDTIFIGGVSLSVNQSGQLIVNGGLIGGGGAGNSLTSNNDINITINNDDSSSYVWNFGQTGDLTFPDGTTQATAYVLEDNLVKVSDEWAVTTGTNTYSFTLPEQGTYVMWVKGNIPNGIIAWNATASVSNSNVPAIGTQFAWNYTAGGSPILLTSIPDQIVGVAGTISTDATYAGSTSNRFDFGISNTSGSTRTIYYGYTRIS